MWRPNYQNPFKKAVIGILLFVVLFFSLFAIKPQTAQAIPVEDIPKLVWDKVTEFVTKNLKKVASKTLGSVLQKVVNRFAIDSATYLASGGKGQQPLFVTEGWGTYAKNIADSATGEFIDGLNKWAFTDENGKPIQINLCEPNLDVKARIGLGLVQFTAPGLNADKPACTFSNMAKNWTDAATKIKDMKSDDYLKRLSNMFDPGGSDLSATLSLMSGADDIKTTVQTKTEEDVRATKGWLDVRSIDGKAESVPGNAEAKLNQAKDLETQTLGQFTGDALVDAANVFLNQLAITAFNNLTGKLGKNTPTASQSSSGRTDFGVNNPDDDPFARRSSAVLQNQLTQILRPRFDTRGDYDILAQLTICSDQSNMGPTDCVIDEQFRQAVESNQTVVEAIKAGYLNGGWRLKRDTDVNQGYSLRAISILRKYRILPVGWETALMKAEAVNQPATLMDFVSCFDPNDSYNEFSQGFIPGAWCQGFVDPNWVLKAPLNYCKREGIGGQILDKTFVPESTDDQGNVLSPSQLIVTRADNYCADEQSCIKEKSDGTCEAYGYCTEEKRTWNFGSDGCDPVFNTCKAFTKNNSSSKVAYLENTLDYSTCTSDNAGCKPYSLAGIYATSTNYMDWKSTKQINFNKNVETCDANSESCQEFIRIKSNLGHNILVNSDFESDLASGGWNIGSATSTAGGYFSNTALKLNGVYSRAINVGPSDYNVAGQAYTFSLYAKDCSVGDKFVFGGAGNDITGDLSTSTDWNYYSATYIFPDNVSTNQINFAISSNACTVDRLKVELATSGTAYSDYGTNSFVYQKLIPNYLEQACYVNPSGGTKDYSLKSTAPASCNNYARKCNASEVGCDQFNSTDGFVINAKASAGDYCTSECVGYDSYIQKETNFSDKVAANFIPKTATKCSATAVGCSEFTNLDQLAQGGEAKEYYTSLRQCIKPDNNQCAVFYSWGNPGSGGYQLIADTLKASNNEPSTIVNDAGLCNAAIYNLPPSHPSYNPDCRQFYNKAGQVFYHLYSNTISCSDNCHPYRSSESPINQICPKGGIWDNNQNACVYQAIPGEGQSCSANENGCREYNGNYGNNVKNIAVFNFESQADNWTGLCQDGATIDNNALNKNGSSLRYNRGGQSCNFNVMPQISASFTKKISLTLKNIWNNIAPIAWASDPLPNYGVAKKIGRTVKQGGSYTVKFLAKANQNTTLKIKLTNGGEAKAFNVTNQNNADINISGNGQWQLYQANLDNLDHEVSDNESIVFSASGSFWFDNVIITEITDRYYLIKDSWQTPDSCYYDVLGNYRGANYNLGCASYTDRNGTNHNLRHFSKLCAQESVGCELLVDTKNSAYSSSQAFNENAPTNNICDGPDGTDCITISADEMIYAIVDPAKSCSATDKGCTRMGAQESFNPDVAVQNLYTNAYIKNNPDKYGTILCRSTEIGCNAWSGDDGQVSYFRDPGSNICEWREPKQSIGMNLAKKWYKKSVKRCDMDNNNKINVSQSGIITESVNKICNSDSDCIVNGAVGKCISDANDYLCPVDAMKTIGFGGAGNKVYQPQGVVGACSLDASSCSEYIDPVSEFAPNLVINPDWGDTNKDNILGDSWTNGTISGTSMQTQSVPLQKNKLYSFSVVGGNNTATILSCPGQIRVLNENNLFNSGQNTITLASTTAKANILFNSMDNTQCVVGGAGTGKVVGVRVTQIGYQLADNIDTETCNGAPKFDSGCILFNQRKVNGGSGLSALNWNAYSNSYNSGTTENCDPALNNCDSNILVKVKPDRVCDKWLSCMSKSVDPVTGEETCYALGECDKLSDNGKCQNFVTRPLQSHNFAFGADRNTAGYSKLGYYYLANMEEFSNGVTGSWDFNSTSSMTGLPSTSRIIVSANDNAIANKKIAYPADGLGFLLIKADPVTIDAGFRATANKEYFVNLLVNPINASNGVTLEINSPAQGGVQSTSTVFTGGNGWQRKVVKFKFANSATGNVTFKLFAASGEGYVDNINLSPVLKAGDNSYIAKECRLYPKQDSLSCQSRNLNTVSDGLYGYCLEYDLKNPSVCSMWYPIDNVQGQSSGAVSGIADTPEYCAQVDGNFIFVEYRQGISAPASINSIICLPVGVNPSSGNGNPTGDLLVGNNGKYQFHQVYKYDGNAGECKNVLGDPGNNCGTLDNWYRRVMNYQVPMGNRLISGADALIEDSVSANNTSYVGQSSVSSACSASSNPTNCDECDQLNYPGIYSYTNGWYEYDGTDGGDVPGKIGVLAYNYDVNECNSISGAHSWIANLNACLIENYADYKPVCAKNTGLVKAEIGWVDRLLNSTSTATFFQSPFDGYHATTSNGFFGSKMYNSVSRMLGGGNSGAPFGCFDSGRQYWNGSAWVSTCQSVNYDNNYNGFHVEPVASPWSTNFIKTFSSAFNTDGLAKALKSLSRIFLRFTWAGTIYDYRANALSSLNFGDGNKINTCPGGVRGNNWCGILPSISNIKLYDDSGNIVLEVSPGKYKINSPGFYTLTFNTNVDKEQVPIQELTIDWGGDIVTVNNVDSKNNVDSPFRFIYYFNPQGGSEEKTIRIKVIDNWGFYKFSI